MSRSPLLEFISSQVGGSQEGGFQKGGFGECSPIPKTATRVQKTERWPPTTGTRVQKKKRWYQKAERGYICQSHPFTKPPFCFISIRSRSVGQNCKTGVHNQVRIETTRMLFHGCRPSVARYKNTLSRVALKSANENL